MVHDLDAIGLDKLVSISQDLSDVKLLAKDSRGCEHVLSVNLETNKIYADFPEGWHFSWKQVSKDIIVPCIVFYSMVMFIHHRSFH